MNQFNSLIWVAIGTAITVLGFVILSARAYSQPKKSSNK